MKLRDLEGSDEEINNFFQNNGLKVQDYFHPAQKPVGWFWVLIPCLAVLAGLSLLVLELPSDAKLRKLGFVVTCFFSVCWATAIQLKFKNAWASGLIAIGCLLLTLVAFGVFTPEEMFEAVKELKESGQ